MMRPRTIIVLVALSLLLSAATVHADSAGVLWEHVKGVVDGRVQDFWLLRAAGETRKECRQLANEQISLEMGELSGMPARGGSSAGRTSSESEQVGLDATARGRSGLIVPGRRRPEGAGPARPGAHRPAC